MVPISIHNAEHYLWGDGCDGWHLLKREGVSVIQERVPPGKCEKRHVHRLARQFFFILEGKASIVFDDQTVTVRDREGVEIPQA